ncbi:hypothetical protein JCGZ_13801 [Jatropha curcas]|uniref:F-box domain-containing protein n=1 Tax=Jatropha curcas TaxID=180498 RepID=A0A067K771_JATCU|nr:F-box protein At3g07870 [Jatropha curcas]KDP30858.1 hypothetical protein JCGZ_13801 [Jatropha curcas]
MEEVSAESNITTGSGFKKIHQEATTMDSLPREIALNILSRLPITSLIHVKSVCLSWRSLAQDPLLATMHFSRMVKTTNPCLILHYDLPIENHLYSLHFSDHGSIETTTRIHIPMISEFDIVGSCNGLLCLWHSLYKDECYIYSPFTRYYIKLPEAKQFQTPKRVALGFGFHPKTKEYKVVRIVYYKKEDGEVDNPQLRRYLLPESEVQVLTLGNGSLNWRIKGKTSYQLLGMSSGVLVNGRLHWLTCRHRYQSLRTLISFDLEDEKFREVPVPSRESFGRHCSRLVILKGCLSAVNQGFRSLYIWVMKEYGVKESWIKEFSIGASIPRDLYYHPEQSIQNFSQARVLCVLSNGEILLQYYCRSLVSYEPNSGTFKELGIRCLPESFNAVVHIASLNWIDTPVDL